MKRPCIGCGTLVDAPANRCDRCLRDRNRTRTARGLTGQRGSTSAWRKLRRRVFERDGYRCVKCDAPYPLECDHVNGDATDDRMDNLQTLCTTCHKAKHAKSSPGRAEWRESQKPPRNLPTQK